jgi:hypothetical protein
MRMLLSCFGELVTASASFSVGSRAPVPRGPFRFGSHLSDIHFQFEGIGRSTHTVFRHGAFSRRSVTADGRAAQHVGHRPGQRETPAVAYQAALHLAGIVIFARPDPGLTR